MPTSGAHILQDSSSASDCAIIPPVRERKGGRTETNPTRRRRGSSLQSVHNHKEERKTPVLIRRKTNLLSLCVSLYLSLSFSLSPPPPAPRPSVRIQSGPELGALGASAARCLRDAARRRRGPRGPAARSPIRPVGPGLRPRWEPAGRFSALPVPNIRQVAPPGAFGVMRDGGVAFFRHWFGEALRVPPPRLRPTARCPLSPPGTWFPFLLPLATFPLYSLRCRLASFVAPSLTPLRLSLRLPRGFPFFLPSLDVSSESSLPPFPLRPSRGLRPLRWERGAADLRRRPLPARPLASPGAARRRGSRRPGPARPRSRPRRRQAPARLPRLLQPQDELRWPQRWRTGSPEQGRKFL